MSRIGDARWNATIIFKANSQIIEHFGYDAIRLA